MLIHLFNGLVHGTLLIVMCSGLALIYGLRRVVNFAHGSLYMLGAYLGYSIALHSNFWVALLVAPALMALLGALLDRWGFRLLQDRDPLSVVLVTFGLLLVIEKVITIYHAKKFIAEFIPRDPHAVQPPRRAPSDPYAASSAAERTQTLEQLLSVR